MTKLHTPGTRFRAEPIRSAAIRISSLCAAILLFASCPGSLIDSGGGSSGAGETGSLSIRLTDAASGDALFSARALVPGVLSQMKAVSISVTDSAGITHEYSASSADFPSAGAQIEDVYPGLVNIAASAYSDAEKTLLLATGTATATVVKGQPVSAAVRLSLAEAGSGTGSLDLNIAFPVDKDIDSITAGFIGTDGIIDSSYPAVLVGSADYSEGTATLHSSEIPAGACTLSVSFLRRGTQIGRIIEAVNIRSGAAANRWIDQNGTLQETRTYSADELGVSAAGLASLSAGGVQVPLSSGTLEYSITLGDSDSISFILSGAIAGQSYRWKWAPEAGMAVEGSASPLVASPALATSGSNLLTITVTAPDGETTQTYVVRVIRSWEVSFNVSGGSYIEPVIIVNGGTVERPADPEYSGFAFSGWYADSSLSTPWTFGSGGRTVTGDAALYAKWVESSIARVSLDLTRDYGNAGVSASSASVTQGQSVVLTASLSGAAAASWAWYVDSVLQTGATSPSFTWTTSVAAVPETSYTISCAVTDADGLAYSAAVKISVLPANRIAYAANGATSGSVPVSALAAVGAVIASQGSLAKSGHQFVNWNTSADGSGTPFAPGSSFAGTSSLVLYAQWRTIPAAPVAARPQSLDGAMTLRLASPDSVRGGIAYYEIACYKDASFSSNSSALTLEQTVSGISPDLSSYTVTGLENYEQYAFQITAVYKEPAGSAASPGTASVNVFGIPGLGRAELYATGRGMFAMSFVPKKTVRSRKAIDPSSFEGSPNSSFYMAQTETTYRLWHEVYRWATSEERGSGRYVFLNAGSQGSVDTNTPSIIGALPDLSESKKDQPVSWISWRDAVVWCNALTEYYNALHGLSGAEALVPVYYADASYAKPLRMAVPTPALLNEIPVSSYKPYIFGAANGNTDPTQCSATGFRLPTEIEWSCASRYICDFDGDGAILADGEFYPDGFASGSDVLGTAPAVIDFDGNGEVNSTSDVANNGPDKLSLNVASRRPNMLGLYDMSGNLHEFLGDLSGDNVRPIKIAGGGYDESVQSCTDIKGNWIIKPWQPDYAPTIRVVRNAE